MMSPNPSLSKFVLCVAVGALWVRSRHAKDWFAVTLPAGRRWELSTQDGGIRLRTFGDWPAGRAAEWRTVEVPDEIYGYVTTDRVIKYDPATNSWSNLAAAPTTRGPWSS